MYRNQIDNLQPGTLSFSDRNYKEVLVELEQSLKALQLAQDLLNGITNSLQVSVAWLLEQESKT